MTICQPRMIPVTASNDCAIDTYTTRAWQYPCASMWLSMPGLARWPNALQRACFSRRLLI